MVARQVMIDSKTSGHPRCGCIEGEHLEGCSSAEQIAWSDQLKSDAQLALLDLGIDLPFSRWRDACEYIAAECKRALYDVRLDVLELLLYAKAKSLAKKRLEGVVNG